MTKRLSETEYLKQARAAAVSVDGGRWELARIAAEMKAAGISEWAEKIGDLDEVRRSARTVGEWAQTWEFRDSIAAEFRSSLPFSFWARASRYAGRVDLVDIVELMESYDTVPGANFESFCAQLSQLASPDGYHDVPAVIRRTTAVSERIGTLGKTTGLPDAYYTALADAQAALAAGIVALEAETESTGALKCADCGRTETLPFATGDACICGGVFLDAEAERAA